ncbi:MAG: 3-oxoacyl-ACP synthase [bacterium]|nr:3-oxoacyl-ACP synthase [bacterium]
MNALLSDILASMENETKSSVGDKHETARARMQFEQGKLEKQLSEIKQQETELRRIDLSNVHSHVAFGSLVETNRGNFFIAIPLGKLAFGKDFIQVISALSPLAICMKGKSAEQSFLFNGMEYRIEEIL